MNIENRLEEPGFTITPPREGDDVAVGLVHKQSWLETYLNPELGITKDVINELIGHVAEESGAEFRRNAFKEAFENPDKILYRVIRDSAEKVVGFMHCEKKDQYNELGGLYILNEAKGQGVGDRLMQEFLAWADQNKPCHLSVFATNDRAIRFYEKYGFKRIETLDTLYKDTIPHFEMVRPAEGR